MKINILHKQLSFSMLAIAMLFLSCKKVINIDVKDADAVLVIEGNVSNNTNYQTEVKVSKSIAITDANKFPAVSGAKVTITSDGRVYNLTEQTAGTYISTALKGQPNKTYQLAVVTSGKTYTASSTMPNPVKLDSVGLNIVTIINKSYVYPEVYYRDPAGIANFYRFTFTVNGTASNGIFVYNDNLTDGRKISRQLRDNDITLVSGNRVTIQMQSIDKNMFDYWNGFNQNQNRGGASTTPANPPSNISGGALGYFSAHTIQQNYFVMP